MYATKSLLALAVLAETSLAQTYLHEDCSSSINDLNVAAPTLPSVLQSAYGAKHSAEPNAEVLLKDPHAYVQDVCNFVPQLPVDLLDDFAEYGGSLLSFAGGHVEIYDAIITHCITTGPAAASITSYLHSIIASPEALCQHSSTPVANGTASITPYPTPTGSNSTLPTTGVPSTSVPTAAAGRPTGALIGAAAIGGGGGGGGTMPACGP
ncbi:hypothetical protein NUW58_g6429 [Xylaria curta]|uniref:Uncharacterized protein n=1 Tax=Xylaria curta TaxID=42375 RepID=A0ACC1NT74_9PEZI|nr:hypothetical protein NUW58_g6429 [Xylaria curta]